MKTITKTFYVSDADFMVINSGHDSTIILRNKNEKHYEGYVKNKAVHEIQISWQEPDVKYKLTVDEIFDLWADWVHENGNPFEFKNYLKKKLEQKNER